MQSFKNILAIDCSTDTLSISLQAGEEQWSEEHEGAAQAWPKIGILNGD